MGSPSLCGGRSSDTLGCGFHHIRSYSQHCRQGSQAPRWSRPQPEEGARSGSLPAGARLRSHVSWQDWNTSAGFTHVASCRRIPNRRIDKAQHGHPLTEALFYGRTLHKYYWACAQAPESTGALSTDQLQPDLTSPFAATVQRALTGSLPFDGREVPLTKLTQQLSLNLAESRARGSLRQAAKSGALHLRSPITIACKHVMMHA